MEAGKPIKACSPKAHILGVKSRDEQQGNQQLRAEELAEPNEEEHQN